MSRLAIALLALALAACGDGAPASPDPTPEPAGPIPSAGLPDRAVPQSSIPATDSVARTDRERRAAAASRSTMPFERSAMVFDTTEPPPVRVQIQPRPRPTPAPPPMPRPAPRPPTPAPRPPEPPATSGSCDVRETESFCFAYTGAGWSRKAATDHCRDAPDSNFRPAVCPTEDAIATCRFTRDGAPTLEIVYTYYAPYDLMLANLACPGEFERIETGR